MNGSPHFPPIIIRRCLTSSEMNANHLAFAVEFWQPVDESICFFLLRSMHRLKSHKTNSIPSHSIEKNHIHRSNCDRDRVSESRAPFNRHHFSSSLGVRSIARSFVFLFSSPPPTHKPADTNTAAYTNTRSQDKFSKLISIIPEIHAMAAGGEDHLYAKHCAGNAPTQTLLMEMLHAKRK